MTLSVYSPVHESCPDEAEVYPRSVAMEPGSPEKGHSMSHTAGHINN